MLESAVIKLLSFWSNFCSIPDVFTEMFWLPSWEPPIIPDSIGSRDINPLISGIIAPIADATGVAFFPNNPPNLPNALPPNLPNTLPPNLPNALPINLLGPPAIELNAPPINGIFLSSGAAKEPNMPIGPPARPPSKLLPIPPNPTFPSKFPARPFNPPPLSNPVAFPSKLPASPFGINLSNNLFHLDRSLRDKGWVKNKQNGLKYKCEKDYVEDLSKIEFGEVKREIFTNDEIEILKQRGFLVAGDVVVNTGSTPVDLHLPTNIVKITTVE